MKIQIELDLSDEEIQLIRSAENYCEYNENLLRKGLIEFNLVGNTLLTEFGKLVQLRLNQ